MTDTETRPVWDFNVPEEVARFVRDHLVTAIQHRREFIGADTSQEWLILKVKDGKSVNCPITVFSDFFMRAGGGLQFKPDHSSLVRCPTNMRARLDEMDKFDQNHEAELAEYRRLSLKFGSLKKE